MKGARVYRREEAAVAQETKNSNGMRGAAVGEERKYARHVKPYLSVPQSTMRERGLLLCARNRR